MLKKHVHTQNKTMDIQKTTNSNDENCMQKQHNQSENKREREVVARNDTVDGRNQAVYARISQAFNIPGG